MVPERSMCVRRAMKEPPFSVGGYYNESEIQLCGDVTASRSDHRKKLREYPRKLAAFACGFAGKCFLESDGHGVPLVTILKDDRA